MVTEAETISSDGILFFMILEVDGERNVKL